MASTSGSIKDRLADLRDRIMRREVDEKELASVLVDDLIELIDIVRAAVARAGEP